MFCPLETIRLPSDIFVLPDLLWHQESRFGVKCGSQMSRDMRASEGSFLPGLITRLSIFAFQADVSIWKCERVNGSMYGLPLSCAEYTWVEGDLRAEASVPVASCLLIKNFLVATDRATTPASPFLQCRVRPDPTRLSLQQLWCSLNTQQAAASRALDADSALWHPQVVYFTALLPYCVLVIYLVRGLTLHGATNGLVYMFTPKVEQLAKPRAWIDAATQIFFSLGLGFGSLIAFASYNEPSNNCQKHTIIVSLINSATSIFASVVTFSIYGFKATFNYEHCLDRVILLLTNSFDLEDGFLTASNLEQVKGYLASTYPSKYSEVFPLLKNCSLELELDTAVQGTGLAFIVYTEAIKNMEVSQLWSVLYFFMLLMLGIGSMLGNTAGILTPLTDSKAISSLLPKEAISGLVCLINCAIGLLFTMEAGSYWFDIFNDYAATLSLLLIVLVETVAVCYVYGLRRFGAELEAMTGRALGCYWKAMWACVSPLLIIGLFLFYLSDYILSGTLRYQAWDATQGQLVTKDYPAQALAVIGLLVGASTTCIPLVALGTFVTRRLRTGGLAPVA
ncbi:sodium- and chloride-dependent transporter XTRP3A isoform X1 [Fukomys damarensis]|uniref:sodium- and chloride-dependent transporter XTRP3A isoform X1 n=1 Tax=Fukomys damarensis TaxID=885580 RepID=UPI001455BA1E|nr:sodium- and chloride-dependent transporter XTRP3A isoform X1 [Fukomys damarensis]